MQSSLFMGAKSKRRLYAMILNHRSLIERDGSLARQKVSYKVILKIYLVGQNDERRKCFVFMNNLKSIIFLLY